MVIDDAVASVVPAAKSAFANAGTAQSGARRSRRGERERCLYKHRNYSANSVPLVIGVIRNRVTRDCDATVAVPGAGERIGDASLLAALNVARRARVFLSERPSRE